MPHAPARDAGGRRGILQIRPDGRAVRGSDQEFSPDAKAAYENADRVAVTTYSSLFNTNPFFDHPEVIIVDDAHASENYIADLWTVRIRRFEPKDETLFKAVAGVLKQVVSETNYARMTGESRSLDDVAWVDKLSTPRLTEIQGELRATIAANVGQADQRWPPLSFFWNGGSTRDGKPCLKSRG